MTPEREAEIRTLADAYSGLQYVVTNSYIQWPWTSVESTNQVVTLVRSVPDLLAALAAERARADRAEWALRRLVDAHDQDHTYNDRQSWVEIKAAKEQARAILQADGQHEYDGACRNVQHADPKCTCNHSVNGRRCGQSRFAPIHQAADQHQEGSG